MTLADQDAITRRDGQVTSGKPGRPQRRAFTAAYKARILAEFDELPEGSPARGELLRRERLYHSHLEDWRRQVNAGTLAPAAGKKNAKAAAAADELARLRAENKKLKAESAELEARNGKLAAQLGKTRTALEIAGKAFALLENISGSADSVEN